MSNSTLGHVCISQLSRLKILSEIENSIDSQDKSICMPLNLTKYVVSQKDSKLQQVILDSSWVIADGVSMAILAKRMGIHSVERIAGIELAEKILETASSKEWRIFILGAKTDVLEAAVSNLEKSYNIKLAGSHDGYFANADEVVEKINSVRPDILLLGLGMPQKEYFIYDYLDKLDIKLCLPVGGAIDVWSGVKKRSPNWIQRIGMEWFYRSFSNPVKGYNILRYGFAFVCEYLSAKNTHKTLKAKESV